MNPNETDRLYQELILEHNKKPKNYGKIENPTHYAEGFNPLCGDHFHVYFNLNAQGTIIDIAFDGGGCAISKYSASLMTSALKGRTVEEAKILFKEFHDLLTGKLNPEKDAHTLGKLSVFSGIWQYPSRVKCASLAWHTFHGALEGGKTVSTE
jgi:nitrogen fixation protein NifU and related proteins